MNNVKKNVILLFPGKGYGNSNPLLYYAKLKYEAMGYDCLPVDYRNAFNEGKTIDDIKDIVFKQLQDIDFSSFGDVVFLSKSVGTVFAGWLAEILGLKIRHIFITPLQGALQYIKGPNVQIVVSGTKDKYLDSNILSEHCSSNNIKLVLIDNANHSLEVDGGFEENIEILKQVVNLY